MLKLVIDSRQKIKNVCDRDRAVVCVPPTLLFFKVTWIWSLRIVQLDGEHVGLELLEQQVPSLVLPPLHQASLPVQNTGLDREGSTNLCIGNKELVPLFSRGRSTAQVLGQWPSR